MSVRKPLIRTKFDDVDVDALIEKGAKVKEDQVVEKNKFILINLRMPTKMLKDVGDAVDKRVGITRNGWILEAIHEKLNGSKNE